MDPARTCVPVLTGLRGHGGGDQSVLRWRRRLQERDQAPEYRCLVESLVAERCVRRASCLSGRRADVRTPGQLRVSSSSADRSSGGSCLFGGGRSGACSSSSADRSSGGSCLFVGGRSGAGSSSSADRSSGGSCLFGGGVPAQQTRCVTVLRSGPETTLLRRSGYQGETYRCLRRGVHTEITTKAPHAGQERQQFTRSALQRHVAAVKTCGGAFPQTGGSDARRLVDHAA